MQPVSAISPTIFSFSSEIRHTNKTFPNIWTKLDTVGTFLYETPANVIIFAVTGITLRLFASKFSAPFLAISASMMLTRLAVKIADRYHFQYLEPIQKAACQLCSKYPKVQLITFLFSIAVTAIAPPVGVACAIALGILGGIMIEIENCKKQQQINQAKQDNPSQNPALSQIVAL